MAGRVGLPGGRRVARDSSLFANLPALTRSQHQDSVPLKPLVQTRSAIVAAAAKDFASDEDDSSASDRSDVDEGPRPVEGPRKSFAKRHADSEDEDVGGRPQNKQQRVQEPSPQQSQQLLQQQLPNSAPHGILGATALTTSCTAAQQPQDQVAMALCKIAMHISQPSKFVKACGLLRQLLQSDSLTKRHRAPLFAAIRAAFRDTSASDEPALRREYGRLIAAVDAVRPPDVLGRAERAQMEVYAIWGSTRAELYTDDSFQFNKTVAHLKALANALPEASHEDEEAHARTANAQLLEAATVAAAAEATAAAAEAAAAAAKAQGIADTKAAIAAAAVRTAKAAAATAESVPPPPPTDTDGDDPFGLDILLPEPVHPPQPPPPPSPLPALNEPADPFGLDTFMAAPAAVRPEAHTPRRPAAPKPATWSALDAIAMRRRALLDCLSTAQLRHKQAWARTSVELLIEHLHGLLTRFPKEQQATLAAAMAWVRAERAARRAGGGVPSAREVARDSTAFERARADWSKVEMSSRGKVGSSGDARQQQWLG